MRTTRLPLLILTTTLITHILIITGQVITGRASVSFLASLGTTAIPAFTDIHGLIMAAYGRVHSPYRGVPIAHGFHSGRH